MNVLSLFDGISCGRVALERAGIKINNYFSSEIDKYAIQISSKNYPSIIQIGDVTKVRGSELPKIDLLIGGSPCQGFSFAGKQLNFDDERSKLFFEYVRILKETKPKYFLLENVKMKKEYQSVISEYLGVEPIEINSALVSAQNRKRLYWTNIDDIEQPESKGIVLKDITVDGCEIGGRIVGRARDEMGKRIDHKQSVAGITKQTLEINKEIVKSNCVSTVQKDNVRVDSLVQVGIADISGFDSIKRVYSIIGKSSAVQSSSGGNREPKITEDGINWRKLSPIECERLQTLPDNYTEGISDTQRYKAIGNGWTVDVIAHIFKNIEK